MRPSVRSHPKSRSWALAVAITFVVLIIAIRIPISQILLLIGGKLSTFATVFLGIFIEAIPFLLLGTLGSGFVEAFLDHSQIQRFIPRRHFDRRPDRLAARDGFPGV